MHFRSMDMSIEYFSRSNDLAPLKCNVYEILCMPNVSTYDKGGESCENV